MPIFPVSPARIDTLIDLASRRALLWYSDFQSGPAVDDGHRPYFSWSFNTTPAHVNTDEGGWAQLGVDGVDNYGGPDGMASGITSPAKNPAATFRVIFAAPNAQVTRQLAGFISALGSSTPNGAYLKQVTTGNLFFVTRQGGVEQATDLGVPPVTAQEYTVRSDDVGVSWQCYAGGNPVSVASHATTVPTAATTLLGGILFNRSAGAHILQIDWSLGEANRSMG